VWTARDREEALPKNVQQSGNVVKGTMLTFSKDLEGNMTVDLNGQPLVSVQVYCEGPFHI
jgi:hypothetical protein